MTLAAIDYDQIAADYAKHRRVHPEVLKQLESTGLGPAAKVLEVGCGTGNYIIALESLTGCAGYGIDPSLEMLAQAGRRSATIRFKSGRAEKLDFPADFFDLVFSVDVIHHVGDPAAYFREVYRVLKPGARLCTVTDSEWIIRHRQPQAVYFPETVEVDLKRYPPPAYLRELMYQAGFTVINKRQVEFPYQLTDIQLYRDKAYSMLHLISPEAFARGLAQLEQDFRLGPIPAVSRYMLLWGMR